MKKSNKAAMLSAFVFPGAGHIFLKKYLSGYTIIGVAAIATVLLIANIMNRAVEIAEKIQSGEMLFDLLTITEIIREQSLQTDSQILSTATTVLMVVWLVSVIDSYRIGKE